jgi:rRNA maturation RNase YbeY
MITVNSKNGFVLTNRESVLKWIEFAIHQENKVLGEIDYVFCEDNYLLEMNIKTMKHNTLTDIISFDYTIQDIISGDIYISTERVEDNAKYFKTKFKDELHRVMIHGIMHYCGYNDKSPKEKKMMRSKEDYYLSLRTF